MLKNTVKIKLQNLLNKNNKENKKIIYNCITISQKMIIIIIFINL